MEKGNLRRQELDIARGFGILMVILGHTVSSSLLRGAIFSFHMPLFFIVGGINYRFAKTKKELIQNISRSFQRLMVPAGALFSLIFIIYFVFGKAEFHIRELLLAIFYSSAVSFKSCFGIVPPCGEIWFLVCLFWCRTICDLLHYWFGDKGYCVSTLVLTCVGVVIGRFVWLPQNLDIALSVLAFFAFGLWIDKRKIVDKITRNPLILIGCMVLAGTGMLIEAYFAHDYLELAIRTYPMFPLCIVIAVLLSLCVMAVSSFFTTRKILKLPNVLATFGRDSLLMFSIHFFDRLWSFVWRVECSCEGVAHLLRVLLRLAMDIMIFYFILFLRRKIKTDKISRKTQQ